MGMTISEMRSLIYAAPQNESVVNDEILSEAAIQNLCDEILDEAYYGRHVAQPILDAMIDCCKLIDENPTIAMNKTKENIALQKAVQKVFGFKSCTIMWENRGMMAMGAYTFPANPTKYGSKPAFKYGQHKDGFYDSKHELPVFIELSNNRYIESHLTPEEMTAILIHEIGHNFDFTPATMFMGWTKAILAIIMLIRGLGDGSWVATLFKIFMNSDIGRNISHIYTNIDIIVMNYVPPLGIIGRGIQKVSGLLMKLMNLIMSPAQLFSIPATLMFAPFIHLVSFFGRRREIYADTFAASYGFGEELGTGLAKADAAIVRFDTAPSGTLMEIMYDFAQLDREFLTMFCDVHGHGSTQQRMLRARAKLERDLSNNDVPPELKKELQEQIAAINDAYEEFVKCDEYDQKNITRFFRGLVDRVYNGKDYAIFEPIRDGLYPE